MRLWSLHPTFLDTKGLVALWREGLLAKKVLQHKTRGYKNHPQLLRFRRHKKPLKALNTYLNAVWTEAAARGFRFDKRKIRKPESVNKIPVNNRQLEYEFRHLLKKLKERDRPRYETLRRKKKQERIANPLFKISNGGIEDWEKTD